MADPLTIEKLLDWLNGWADEDSHFMERPDPRWRKGYEDAISDVFRRVQPLAPDWIATLKKAKHRAALTTEKGSSK